MVGVQLRRVESDPTQRVRLGLIIFSKSVGFGTENANPIALDLG